MFNSFLVSCVQLPADLLTDYQLDCDCVHIVIDYQCREHCNNTISFTVPCVMVPVYGEAPYACVVSHKAFCVIWGEKFHTD